MDKVLIRQLRVDTVIGVYEWEKTIHQSLLLDLDMAWDNKPAAATDDYQYALCYETVSNRLTELITEHPIELIETVAERIAEIVLAHEQAQRVTVTLHKPNAPITVPFSDVSVTISRDQSAPAGGHDA